jgi:hypothetical protein
MAEKRTSRGDRLGGSRPDRKINADRVKAHVEDEALHLDPDGGDRIISTEFYIPLATTEEAVS